MSIRTIPCDIRVRLRLRDIPSILSNHHAQLNYEIQSDTSYQLTKKHLIRLTLMMHQNTLGNLKLPTRQVTRGRLEEEERFRRDGVPKLLDVLEVVAPNSDDLVDIRQLVIHGYENV